MTERQYVFKVTDVVKVTDGDTYWLRVDVGFRQWALINVRLAGYDCPESNRGSVLEKAAAITARQEAVRFLTAADPHQILWIRTEKDPDNFGRWLGEIWRNPVEGTTKHLGDWLRDFGLASVWPTRWRDEFDKENE